MPRPVTKPPYFCKKLDKAVVLDLEKGAGNATRVINTKSRSSTILPSWIGAKIGVHNGREFVNVLIQAHHVGHKLGEFSLTRKFPLHPADRKKK